MNVIVPSDTSNGPSEGVALVRVREGKTIELSCPVINVPPLKVIIIAFDIILLYLIIAIRVRRFYGRSINHFFLFKISTGCLMFLEDLETRGWKEYRFAIGRTRRTK